MMAHDASFLAKCEQFLLHPTVRALSLAQRVDFLEKKGLSPVEITACLKNVERQNGLSTMLATVSSSSVTSASSSAAQLPVWALVKRYGVAAAATIVLAYGYVWLRHAMVIKLVAAHRAAVAKRTQQRQATVMDMLVTLAGQRKQYEQVAQRVQTRVTRAHQLRDAEKTPQTNTNADMRREQELRALREQVSTLRSAVVDAYKSSIEHEVTAATTRKLMASLPSTAVSAQPPAAGATVPVREPHPDLATIEELLDEKPQVPLTQLAV